ncbi:NADP-dependent oxidoreductase [Pectobacterium jejuense]|uniref:NADP-dependent oxidoreductase n=1 Tax=Pectobacterium jejuense TaxID=2974022 RepID=A0ABW8GY57_9GAMM
MKAAFIHTFGASGILTLGERRTRTPHLNDVTVRVEAASVNPLDLQMIAGDMQQLFPAELPYVPGTDFSGIIESVGAQVTHLRPGDRVVGRTAPGVGGAFAESLVISADDLCLIPSEMNIEQAAALPTAFGTAWQALFDVGSLQRGQRVLIHAAAGGVGSMAVQLAHQAGAYVVATASSKNLDLVRKLGADEVIDYRSQDFEKTRDIDLVLDTVGGDTLKKSWSVLRTGGRIATLVEFGIKPMDGYSGTFVFFASATPFLPHAMRLFLTGQLQVIIDSIFPLSEARLALEKVATRHACGKVLIRASH